MMKIKVLTSGSAGNCTAFYTGGKIILIDCGKAVNWTLEKLEYKLPSAVLLTHEHGDHSKAVKSFLKRGVDVYMTQGTVTALELRKRHNLHKIICGVPFEIGDVRILPIPAIHDAAEPVNFILQDETDRILHVTDTSALPTITGDFTKILIEANYSEPTLIAALAEEPSKRRILENHLSIEQAIAFLKKFPAEEVHLIHISKRHGNGEEFKTRAIAETGIQNIFDS